MPGVSCNQRMEEHKIILKKVGVALLVVGLFDIGVMVYCIVNKLSYSSSFNVFAVIAGILLWRGSIKTARVVEWFGSFMFMGFIGIILAFMVVEPFSLKVARFNVEPMYTTASYLFAFVAIAFIFWMTRELSKEPILEARKVAGLSVGKPVLAYALGGLLATGLAFAMYWSNHGDSGRLVKAKANEVYGDSYKIYVSGMNWAGSSVSAQMLAFNELEILQFAVECDTKQLTNGSSGCSLSSPR